MIRLSALAYVEIRPSRAWRCAQTDYSCMNLDGSSWATLIRCLLFKKSTNRRFHSPRHIAALLTTPPSHTLEERHLDLLFLGFLKSVFVTESCAKPSVGGSGLYASGIRHFLHCYLFDLTKHASWPLKKVSNAFPREKGTCKLLT